MIKVCYFGTYRSEYSRNIILIKGLRQNNVKVIECHENLWYGINDRVNAVRTGFINPHLWIRAVKVYIKLIKKYFSIRDYDIMVIGYPGQFDVFLGRILTWLKRRKLVLDVFMSIYLISIERGLEEVNPWSTRFIKFIERISLRFPDQLIIDTKYYAEWLHKTYKVPLERFIIIPTGADNEIFSPVKETDYTENPFTILYYGSFIPNHGVPFILKAARLANNDPDLSFILIGEGPDLNNCINFVEQNHIVNIQFLPWLNKEELKYFISKAQIILGAFGKTPQSLMTVQNKIYEALAMKKAVISGDSPAIRDAFNGGEIIVCDRDNPQKLIDRIYFYRENRQLLVRIAANGYTKFIQCYSTAIIGKKFADQLIKISNE